MTRTERVARAYGLRYVGGWTNKRIAAELGVCEYTVSVYFRPDAAARYAATAKAKTRTAEKRREWTDKSSRLTCGECGGRMATWSKYTGGERCKSCHHAALRVGDVTPRGSRDDAIVRAWHRMLADGSSIADVARSLKMPKPVLLAQVQRLREEGRDLPYPHVYRAAA